MLVILDALAIEARVPRGVDPAAELLAELGQRWSRCTGQRPEHERPLARPAADEPLSLKVPVRLEHGVRVDGDSRDDLPHCRQLVTNLEHAQAKRPLYLLHQLQVGRHARSAIQVELGQRLPAFRIYNTIYIA